jgi:nucleotide-binding universal stress UspA family protein
MIRKVVVPLDGSPLAAHALRPARSLAEATGASLLLLTTHWEDGVGGARAHLDQEAVRLGFERLETVIVHDRSPADAILVESHDPGTLVCMATHGRGGVGQAVLGSVAEGVIRDAKHPVLLVGPSSDPGWKLAQPGNLLVAVDGSQTAEAVVPVASEWVRMLDLTPCVVQVLPGGKDIVERPREVESEYVREIAGRCSGEHGSSHWQLLRALDPAAALVDHARRLPATLVAMATHGYTGLTRVAVGSVAMRVIRQSQCPVLLTAGEVERRSSS